MRRETIYNDGFPRYLCYKTSELTLKSTEYTKCNCDICTETELVDDYDILSSALHPNKAGFARYRDYKETKQVADLKLLPLEMQQAMDGLSYVGHIGHPPSWSIAKPSYFLATYDGDMQMK